MSFIIHNFSSFHLLGDISFDISNFHGLTSLFEIEHLKIPFLKEITKSIYCCGELWRDKMKITQKQDQLKKNLSKAVE
jgi:hypothetical protein